VAGAGAHWSRAHVLFPRAFLETAARVDEALLLGRKAGDAWVVSVALFVQGLTAFERGDHQLAVARALEARSDR